MVEMQQVSNQLLIRLKEISYYKKEKDGLALLASQIISLSEQRMRQKEIRYRDSWLKKDLLGSPLRRLKENTL